MLEIRSDAKMWRCFTVKVRGSASLSWKLFLPKTCEIFGVLYTDFQVGVFVNFRI